MANHNLDGGEVTLARTLGLFDATMIGLGAMIGAGVFVLTGIAAGGAGPAAIIAFALNGIVTTFTAFSYAELASAIPEAGGGYSFVKRAMPPALGFLSGWMLWFAYTVACALYAVGFGGYFVELLGGYWPAAYEALIGTLGHHYAVALVTFFISAFFISLNVLGADVTGKAENIVTMAKIIILGLFISFGLIALFKRPDAVTAFKPMFPKGFGGVIAAMGLTFIAFEGYDLIATVSEEVKDPKKNIPKATFISLGAAVLIYLFILLVSIGAVDPTGFDVYGKTYDQLPAELEITEPLDPNDPEINTSWEILGIYKETGIVRAARELYAPVRSSPYCLWRAFFHHVCAECHRSGLVAGQFQHGTRADAAPCFGKHPSLAPNSPRGCAHHRAHYRGRRRAAASGGGGFWGELDVFAFLCPDQRGHDLDPGQRA